MLEVLNVFDRAITSPASIGASRLPAGAFSPRRPTADGCLGH
jgi:hypothetical protein